MEIIRKIGFLALFGFWFVPGWAQYQELSEAQMKEWAEKPENVVETAIGEMKLPAPYSSKPTAKVSKKVPWPENKMPKAPSGFTVSKFAEGLENPRWTYVAPNHDFFVVESKANRIQILRDENGDGKIDKQEIYLDNLNKPFGMLVLDECFYVANTDGLYTYSYDEKAMKMEFEGKKILDLPAGGYNNHWTRNIIAGKNDEKIFISVGSSSNAGENGMKYEKRRANVLEINLDGSGENIYASGLRNPVGMDWNPITGDLWVAVNERDNLGNNLVPDYITSVQEGGWYGWPFSYFGHFPDPRWAQDPHPKKVKKALVPDVPVGSHTASLGFTFYNTKAFPEKYRNGAFVGQHGSWNRKEFAGYKVLFVPFSDGKPGQPEDFLTGFIADEAEAKVYGRPVGVTVAPDGSLLVNDDMGGVVWKVSVK